MNIALPTLFSISLMGCTSELSELVVLVQSDYDVPSELAVVHVAVQNTAGRTLAEQRFSLDDSSQKLPLSFGVIPLNGDPDTMVRIEVSGLAPESSGGRVLVTRSAVVRFLEQQTRMLPIVLHRSCEAIVCDASATCAERGCASEMVDVSSLLRIGEGGEFDTTCVPGEKRCSTDGTAIEICDGTGAGFNQEDCQAGCDADLNTCAAPEAASYELEVVRSGLGSGTVRSTPSGIECGSVCSASFAENSSVVLEVLPDAQSTFQGWSGVCAGFAPCTVVMNQDKSVTASLGRVSGSGVTLTVQTLGSGLGRVTSSPPGIDCGAGGTSCSKEFARGTSVTLTAQASPGSAFSAWTGAPCTGIASCIVVMNSPMSLQASFMSGATSNMHRVSIARDGTGLGHVMGNGFNCAPTCDLDLVEGTWVSLSATADASSTFRGWSGPCSGMDNCDFTVNGQVDVTATFALLPLVSGSRFDLNGDGFDDLVFGAPKFDLTGFVDSGSVYVLFGPRTIFTGDADAADRTYDGGSTNANFGASIALPGDIDGDGSADLAIGAPGSTGAAGQVYVIRGGSTLPASGGMNAASFTLSGISPGDRFGATVSRSSDVNGDGVPDLVVSAPARSVGAGAVYVFFGGTAFSTRSAAQANVILSGALAGDRFGAAVAFGDLNADGTDELIIGAPGRDVGALADAGVVYVFSGGSGLVSRLATAADFELLGNVTGTGFGEAVAGIGDWNSDGWGDVAVGAGLGGRVYVFHGSTAFATRGIGQANVSLIGAGPTGGGFGSSLAAPGDITGDSVPDLLVGAPSENGVERGAVRIFAGGMPPASAPIATIFGGCFDAVQCTGERLGMTVAFAGDLNNDGFHDFSIGSSFGGGAGGSVDRGRVIAIFGGTPALNGNSEGARVQIRGEDQAGAMCTALDGAPVR